jgi:prepilin-type N-terminal cleavage/methylation domain-containing protein
MVAFRFELPPVSYRLSAGKRFVGRRDGGPAPSPPPPAPRAFTLVEMLVAMAITLVMMAAVVTLFANVSNSVRNRRATVEMTNQLRHLRNTLQQDLQGATCPGATWQRPESNHGYIELIEGIHNDQNPTGLVKGDLDGDGKIVYPNETELDPQQSTVPRNNIALDGADGSTPNGEITAREIEQYYRDGRSFVLGGLGDHDDVLMLTVRNEQQPFVGRVPTNVRDGDDGLPFNVSNEVVGWDYNTVESPLAEVVWFCVENPAVTTTQDPERFFGEAGIRTIYRRTFLIAPWLNPYSQTDNTGRERPFTHTSGTFTAEPGLMRILPQSIALADVPEAIACIIAFQDRYDLSVRLEWDHNIQRWKIMANTLADLTKRENRFGHFGYDVATNQRVFPFALMSTGRGYSGNVDLAFAIDPEVEITSDPDGSTAWEATINQTAAAAYVPKNNDPLQPLALGEPFSVRPFMYLEDAPDGGVCAVANAVLDESGPAESGYVVRVTHGPVPLWGARRGQDVMMTEVLGFDVRVYDPGAPIYGRRDDPTNTDTTNNPITVLQPSDPGWRLAYNADLGLVRPTFEFMGQGAYVDMGYTFLPLPYDQRAPNVPSGKSWTLPWFAIPRSLIDVYYDSRTDKINSQLAPGYAVYDTWSFHYENNGVNEDLRRSDGSNWQIVGTPQDPVDEGTNGFDDYGNYVDAWNVIRLGPDDVGERETVPPYDKPLRGVQVLVRTYEVDSRAIRQVRVNQHFLPE